MIFLGGAVQTRETYTMECVHAPRRAGDATSTTGLDYDADVGYATETTLWRDGGLWVYRICVRDLATRAATELDGWMAPAHVEHDRAETLEQLAAMLDGFDATFCVGQHVFSYAPGRRSMEARTLRTGGVEFEFDAHEREDFCREIAALFDRAAMQPQRRFLLGC